MATVQEVETEGEENSILEEVNSFKNVLSKIMLDKSLSIRDEKKGLFYYLVSRKLGDIKTEFLNMQNLILSTDGKKLYVGPLYEKLKETYLKKGKEKEWNKLKVALILHEILHVLHGHAERAKLASDRELYNIVADLFVNTEIERKLNVKIPNTFVTLDSFLEFILKKMGGILTPSQQDAIKQLGRLEVGGELSVEQVYNTLLNLGKEAVSKIKKQYGRGNFFGHDLSTGKKEKGEGGGEQENHASKGKGERDTTRELREIRGHLSRIVDEFYRAKGEYEAIKREWMKTRGAKGAGETRGVIGEAEYTQIQTLTIPIDILFLREVGDTVSDTKVTFSQYDDDAYWLPEITEEKRHKVLALLDASPSIGLQEVKLFMALVKKAMTVYDIEYGLSVFGAGELKYMRLDPENFSEKDFRIPLGAGTTWDKSIAERIRAAMKEGVRLIQVLSDFAILYHGEALKAIEEFKRMGGRIACYSTTGTFGDFCDTKVKIPEIPG